MRCCEGQMYSCLKFIDPEVQNMNYMKVDVPVEVKSLESAKYELFYQNKRDHIKCMLLFIYY